MLVFEIRSLDIIVEIIENFMSKRGNLYFGPKILHLSQFFFFGRSLKKPGLI